MIPGFNFTSLTIIAVTCFLLGCKESRPKDLPNILWITSEDNSPFAGCYGDSFATTPNMDKLASQGFLYTHAYANAPVCAPTRNTILTGVYACSGGNQHMRSSYSKSQTVKPYPLYLREAGYYCTNNDKEDYNIPPEQTRGIWDESSKKAHYKNRKPGQPFFAVFNSLLSHESSLHKRTPLAELRHDPKQVKLPPYHPNTPDMRHDWAQYYDKIEDMDAWIGKILADLEESGEAENTIVFYYGDHGGVLARSKRYVYESGTHVPFIVRIPKKYKYLFPAKDPGTKVNRLISFVDLVPTLLSIVGMPIPEYLQGNAFLGDKKTPDPEYAFMFRDRMDERYDMSRAVRDSQFRYIRNYMPYRPWGQHIDYLWNAPSIRSWEQAFINGECNEIQSRFWLAKPAEELYDTEQDPWEVNNLANNPAYAEKLGQMRKACVEWSLRIYDTGFLPEAELNTRAGGQPFYDFLRTPGVPLKQIVDAANLAIEGKTDNLHQLIGNLENSDNSIRYWGATGLLILGNKAGGNSLALEKALSDSAPNVVVVAAEALYNLGKKQVALEALQKVLRNTNEFARCHALNAIDLTGSKTPKIQQAVIELVTTQLNEKNKGYDLRCAKWLIQKWGLDESKYNIKYTN